jgi:peptidoglycan/xylan/chitin deacetylase (PgdA/CDA1 family)
MRSGTAISVLALALSATPACTTGEPAPIVAPPHATIEPTMSPVAEAPAVLASAIVTNDAAPPAYAGWTTNEPLVPHDETRAIVLMYHAIDHGHEERGITPKTLDAQLRYLEEQHIAFVPMHELVRWLDHERELPKYVAVLTIDDGELTFYSNAYSVFRDHHAPFVLGLPTAAIEQSKERKVTMSWDQIREIMGSGLCEIASHGHTHAALGKLPIDRVRYEAETPRDLIEKNLGFKPETFFFPMGSANAEARAEIERAGYAAAFGAVGDRITDSTSRFMIPRFGVTRDTTPFIMTRFLHNAGIDMKPASHW